MTKIDMTKIARENTNSFGTTQFAAPHSFYQTSVGPIEIARDP